MSITHRNHQVLTFKSFLMSGQTDHLQYNMTLFLPVCSGLDPDDTNPVFSPLLVTYTHTNTLTPGCHWRRDEPLCLRKTDDLTCYTATNTRDLHPHHTNTHTWASSETSISPSSAALTHAADTQERVRDYLADAGVHNDVWGNKQADVPNEVGSFEHSEGIWVTPSHESPTGRLSCFDHRHRWRWLMKREGCGLSEILRFRPRDAAS